MIRQIIHSGITLLYEYIMSLVRSCFTWLEYAPPGWVSNTKGGVSVVLFVYPSGELEYDTKSEPKASKLWSSCPQSKKCRYYLDTKNRSCSVS